MGTLSRKSWKHAGRKPVDLASGAGTVYQVPATLQQAIRGGRVPNTLLQIALQVEQRGVQEEDIAKMSREDLEEWWDFQDWLIADTLNAAYEEPWFEGEDGLDYITAEDIAAAPPQDRMQLWTNAIHVFDEKLQAVLESLEAVRSFRDRSAGRSAEALVDGSGPGDAAE